MDFPSEEDFTQRVQSRTQQPALKWRDLTVGVVYHINEVRNVTTRFGPGSVLRLTTRENETVVAWAPTRLAKELWWSPELPRYVRPLGLSPCNNLANDYHQYELL